MILIQNWNDIKGIFLIGYERASSDVSHWCVPWLIRMRDMTHLRYSRGPAVAQGACQQYGAKICMGLYNPTSWIYNPTTLSICLLHIIFSNQYTEQSGNEIRPRRTLRYLNRLIDWQVWTCDLLSDLQVSRYRVNTLGPRCNFSSLTGKPHCNFFL